MGSIAKEDTFSNTSTIQLPVFNVSDLSLDNAKRLVDATIEYGFLYISPEGTPFTESLVSAQFDLSKQFFASPLDEKKTYHVGKTNRGWLGLHNEVLDPTNNPKEFKEGFNIGEFRNGEPQQKMPPVLSTDSAMKQLKTFENACKETCNKVLDLIGLGLEVEDGKDWFSKRHGQPSGCTVRMLHYPSLPEEGDYSADMDVRAGAHSDYGSLTLLFQRLSQPGLQIRPPHTNPTTTSGNTSWSSVPVFPPNYPSTTFPPILVNIGDLMSYWTNGLLRSTVHRVIFPKDTKASSSRYSLVYFGHPSDDEELVAVPSKMVRECKERLVREGKYEEALQGCGAGLEGGRALTAREHLLKRLGATYTHRIGKSGVKEIV